MMTDMTTSFYEDDEPVEDVVAAFERGTKQVTESPGARGFNFPVSVAGVTQSVLQKAAETINRPAALTPYTKH